MELDYRAIGKRIKIARIKADLTQEALAEKASLSTTHMSNIETGNSKLSLPTIWCGIKKVDSLFSRIS